MDLTTTKGRLFFLICGLILLSFVAEKSRQLIGEERSSKSGKFSIMNCFDMGSGSVACAVKEGVKLYTYNIRAGIVDKARIKAYEIALEDALHEGQSITDASKLAQAAGIKAGKFASRKARRITGPVLGAAWDFFETIYYGGGPVEASMRGVGTLCGAWLGGVEGERKLGRVGYLIGSHVGNWLGGRIGLMLFDVGNGVWYLSSAVKGFVGGSDEEIEVATYESEL